MRTMPDYKTIIENLKRENGATDQLIKKLKEIINGRITEKNEGYRDENETVGTRSANPAHPETNGERDTKEM